MKSVKSMPAIAHRSSASSGGFGSGVGGLGVGNAGLPSQRSNLQRSQSMAAVQRPHERMKVMARRVPFMAFPGVGSQLGVFVRSFSRANLQRMGSRVASQANLGKMGSSYGSMDFGRESSQLGAAPSPFDRSDRDSSEGPLFGNTFAEDDLESMQPGFTLALGMAVFTAVLASFQVGYNSGVLNVPQSTIVASLHLSTLQWSIAVAIFCIGGLLGSMTGAKMADRLGRKNFLIANNGLFIMGGLLESLAGSCVMLSLGRLAIGIGCGGATVVVPMYLGEIAPANLRGSLGTMNQFAMVIGILIANLLGKPLGGEHSWRYLLGLCLVPSLLQIILAATLLESPLWLLRQSGSHRRRHAEEVLSALRGTDDVEFDVECMLASVNEDDEEEEEEGNNNGGWGDGGNEYQTSRRDSAADLFGDRPSSASHREAPAPHVEKGSIARLAAAQAGHSLWAPQYRRPLMIGLGLQLAQQFSGINAVFFYSTAFFTSAHMSDPWLGSVLASTVNVLATGLSIYLIERMGRRKLLLISTAGMMLSCVGLTWALRLMQPDDGTGGAVVGGTSTALPPVPPPAWVGYASVVMVLVFVSFFEIGLGPIPWLIGAEIFPSRIRSDAMGLSSTLNWLSNFAVGLTFPTISLALGPYSFVPFGGVLFLAFLLEFQFVPETQGKSLEEIQEAFLAAEGFGEEDEGEDGPVYGGSSVGGGTPRSRLGLSDMESEEVEEDGEEEDDVESGWGSTGARQHQQHQGQTEHIFGPAALGGGGGSGLARSSAASVPGGVGGGAASDESVPATPIPEGVEESSSSLGDSEASGASRGGLHSARNGAGARGGRKPFGARHTDSGSGTAESSEYDDDESHR